MTRKALLDALLDHPSYHVLYTENANFHQSIDIMLAALPDWVSQCASGAYEQEAELAEAMRAVMYGPIPNVLLALEVDEPKRRQAKK
jgi:hypothetical protein